MSALNALQEVAQAATAPGQPQHLFNAVERAAKEHIGHTLFTLMVVHHDTLEVERLYSNMPQAYPVGGRKKKRDTWWGRHVVEDAAPFVGHGPADLEKAFADHELIKSLGLGCVLNMPVVYDGRCRGTMNLLDAGDVYNESNLPMARALAGYLLPAILNA